jgi:hypothetical protein
LFQRRISGAVSFWVSLLENNQFVFEAYQVQFGGAMTDCR